MNAQTKMEPPTLAKLREPFPPNQISKLPKETKAQIDARRNDKSLMVWKCPECGGAHHKNAVHLDYVGHAALTDRLLDTDPHWTWEPVSFGQDGLPVQDKNGGLWIKLTVLDVTRLGYGAADGKSGGDAIKEIIGDALRNAAMRFGAALDLWHKGDLHVDDTEDETPAGRGKEPNANGQHDDRINEEQLALIKQLLDATKTTEGAFLKGMGAPSDARLFQLPQSLYQDGVDKLNAKLAKMARAETNAKAVEQWQPPANQFADIPESDIPF